MSGLMDLTGRISRVAGPGLAGLLLAVMPLAGLFWLDSATFALSAAALVLLPSRARRAAAAPVRPAAVAGQGVRALVATHPATAVVLAVHGMGVFAGAVALAMPALLATRLHAGVAAYGAVLAAVGLGALAGNLVAGNVRLPGPLPAVYCGAWAVSGLVLAATGGDPHVRDAVDDVRSGAGRRRPTAGVPRRRGAVAGVSGVGLAVVLWWHRTRVPLPVAGQVRELARD